MSSNSRKNILFIYTDQMHKFALNCMGTSDIITPNLDKLAEEGVLFRNTYSNCPICTPFRINLITGMYTRQTGMYRNESPIPKSCTTLMEEFRRGGYRTSFVGKWHVGDNGNGHVPEKHRRGWDEFIGFQCYNGFYKDVNFYDKDGEVRKFNRHRTDVATDLAIERLENLNGRRNETGQPFLLMLGYQAPHYPVQPAPKYEEMYEGVKVKRRPNMKEIDPYTGTASPRSPRPPENCPDFQRYGNDLDEYLRLYYALVTQIDANVGRIIQKLKDLGIYKETVIIFTSDHGDMQGSHGLKNKTHPYEESSGIPLIVRVPGGVKGIVSDGLIEAVDFFPSCLDYAGIDSDINLPGKSFAPFTMGEEQDLSKPVYSEIKSRKKWKMIRTPRYKLVVDGGWRKRPIMLFDMKEDPYEMNNLVDEEKYNSTVETLRRKIKQWQKYCRSHKKR